MRFFVSAFLIPLFYLSGQSYQASTVAGTTSVLTGIPAKDAFLRRPMGVASDAAGNIYFSDQEHNRILKIATDGRISVVAGMGLPGFNGDNSIATAARLSGPTDIVLDRQAANLYFVDQRNFRVRRVELASGIITTIAGNGRALPSGDGAEATRAGMAPDTIAIDPTGTNLYIAELRNHRVRRIVLATGIVSTFVGTGVAGLNGDSGPATAALIDTPTGIGTDGKDLYIADWGNSLIRKVDLTTRVITKFAGTGRPTAAGDGGEIAVASFSGPDSLSVDAAGNILIGDANRFRWIAAESGTIQALAGSGNLGFIGDGTKDLPAVRFANPRTGVIAGAGTYLIVDTGNYRIRRIRGGEIETVAGSGTVDGRSALSTNFSLPAAAVRDRTGNMIVADLAANRVRRIAASTSVVSTIAGTGVRGSAEGRIAGPSGVAIGTDNSIYFSDTDNNRIQVIRPDGIKTVAGFGFPGFAGDGRQATTAFLSGPRGLALDSTGNLFIADWDNGRVRKINADGIISTVAGTGNFQYSGDGGRAVSAGMSPADIAVDAAGNIYIADDLNGRVRRVAADTGLITTVAGKGEFTGQPGDGGSATSAELLLPNGVAVDAQGNLFIADLADCRVRRVDARTGVITTIAGTGTPVHNIESGPGLGMNMAPYGISIDSDGVSILVADAYNDRIRRLTPVAPRTMTMRSGDNESGQPGARLPVVVRVLDAAGAPLGGVLVNFVLVSGSARLQSTGVQTGLDGLAIADVILGETIGPVVVRAESQGLPSITFNLAVAPPQVTVLNPSIEAVAGLPGSVREPVRALVTGSLVAITGVDLAPSATRVVATSDLTAGKLPTTFNGACVDIGGVRAPLLSVGPRQIVAQVPALAAGATATVSVIARCGLEREFTSPALELPVRTFAPEFFYARKNGEGAVALLSLATGNPATSVKPGDDVISYLTGLGPTQPAMEPGVPITDNLLVTTPVTLKLGSLTLSPEALIYVGTTAEHPGEAFVGGISQNVGVYQIRFLVPEDAPDGELPIFAEMGGIVSPAGAVLKVERTPATGVTAGHRQLRVPVEGMRSKRAN